MTTEPLDADDASPSSVAAARAATRRKRSHAALGSRVFVGGLSMSATVGLAGVMARPSPAVAAAPVREALLTIVAAPTRMCAAPPAHVRIAARPVGRSVAPGVTRPRNATGQPVTPLPAASPANAGALPPTTAAPVPAATAPATAPPPPAPTPAPAPAPTPAPAPRPTTVAVAPPPTSAPVVVPPAAPPVTTSHASPPPP